MPRAFASAGSDGFGWLINFSGVIWPPDILGAGPGSGTATLGAAWGGAGKEGGGSALAGTPAHVRSGNATAGPGAIKGACCTRAFCTGGGVNGFKTPLEDLVSATAFSGLPAFSTTGAGVGGAGSE